MDFHQLLSTVGVYKSNRGMWVWVKKEDALRVIPVPDSFIIHTILEPSKWMVKCFMLKLKYRYLSKTIPFLKCPLVPTFLLFIKERRCNQKEKIISLKEPFTWDFFVLFFSNSCLHLILISRKKTDITFKNV